MQNIRKNYITLIEIMVVITLIALVAGALAYNYYGSLEEGRAFKSRAGKERIETALNLIMAENPSASIDSWKELLKSSPMVKDPEQIVRDGWGREYTVTLEHGNVKVTSPGLTEYENRKSGGRPSGASSAIGS